MMKFFPTPTNTKKKSMLQQARRRNLSLLCLHNSYKFFASTTYVKLQYQLGGTENGTGSVRQAYCNLVTFALIMPIVFS